ncbi:hypothetical protein ABT124_41945 [Streptomyces sp. NPDC001982]|uniref:hypothetical protein n=1 Tax=Streptomyces sp. NPDC001982 TaxID=3154405 RepID=UPI003320624E
MVEAELAGIRHEDIDVEISERELCIAGEYKEREREGVLRRRTRRTGRFEWGRCCLPTSRPTRSRRRWPTGCLPSPCPRPRRPSRGTSRSPRPELRQMCGGGAGASPHRMEGHVVVGYRRRGRRPAPGLARTTGSRRRWSAGEAGAANWPRPARTSGGTACPAGRSDRVKPSRSVQRLFNS